MLCEVVNMETQNSIPDTIRVIAMTAKKRYNSTNVIQKSSGLSRVHRFPKNNETHP
jgi:hypothetical protein